MIFVLSSSSSSSMVASGANLLLVLCVVGYLNFTVFSSIFCLSILPDLDTISYNHHPLHCCCCCCCCLQVFCWYITQFSFLSCCASIHPLPAPEPSGRVLCCTFIDAPDIVCDSSRPTLGMCVLFLVLVWYFHPLWSTSYPHDYKYERLF